MSLSFGMTNQDISNALPLLKLTEKEQQYIIDNLDTDEVSSSALFADDLSDQTELAYRNIREQFKQKTIDPTAYFNVSSMRTTFTSYSLEESINALRNGAQEVPEFAYSYLRDAYDAGHDPREYMKKHNL